MSGWLSSSVGGQVRFETTQWSLVSAASDEAEKQAALAGLYRSYCTPVYFFVRRRGYSREDAQDLTQDFFLHLVEKNAFSRADPSRGKFRTFLLGALEFFLHHEAERARSQRRGGQSNIVFVDAAHAEAQYQLVDSALTAEQIFDARWAGTLIEGALTRLEEEMEQAGKRELYNQISGFVMADEESSYLEVAQRTGLTVSAIKTAIHRLRSRYRALLRDEIARTVTSSADFDEEIRALRSSLIGRRYRR
jgi:RNA polymerase sigma factor (sigma-70 family)